jgi:hypothetical protein
MLVKFDRCSMDLDVLYMMSSFDFRGGCVFLSYWWIMLYLGLRSRLK